MMSTCVRNKLVLLLVVWTLAPALATDAKLDADTCNQLRLEELAFKQSGVTGDFERGAEWAKANLAPERLREVERYIALDEQVKFGCRDAKLTLDALRAADEARKIDLGIEPDAPAAASHSKNDDEDGTGSDETDGDKHSSSPQAVGHGAKKSGKSKASSERSASKTDNDGKTAAGSSDDPALKAHNKSKPKPKPDDAYSAATTKSVAPVTIAPPVIPQQ
jgi:hypothetical protein